MGYSIVLAQYLFQLPSLMPNNTNNRDDVNDHNIALKGFKSYQISLLVVFLHFLPPQLI